MSYNKDLKNDDKIKIQLVELVRNEGLNITQAANTLGIAPRTAQIFFQEGTQWSKDWWEGFNKQVYSTRTSQHTEIKEDSLIGCLLKNPYEVSLKDVARSFNYREYEVSEDGKWLNFGKKVEKEIFKKDIGNLDNSRVLVISDLHFPYHHKDVFKFLQYLKDKYNPTRVICMGDEIDHHALSFHDSDPDLPSAGDELRRALPFVKQLYEMFPVMDILDSNHGSMVYRKAKHHGVPRHYIKSYNDVMGVGEGWKWSFDLTIDLPNGTKCYFHHGKSPDVIKLSQVMGMSAVQGHYHSVFKADYWANPSGLYFGMQTACLVDRDAYAFAYENCNLKKPIIGTGLIINSHPVLEPLIMDEYGNWIGG